VTAVDGGRSVDTSMGYTPYEGLMMATRAGSIDPGILLRLGDARIASNEVADALAHESGLRAITGTPDMRAIEARADAGEERARLAIGMFARRAAAAIAAAMTALPAADALVFTGGIGEHSPAMRGEISRRLQSVGIRRVTGDPSADAVLESGPPAIVVVHAREEMVIAAEVVDATAR
jgi:acetate kinase